MIPGAVRLTPFLALAAVVAMVQPIQASDPVGIYCLLERVVFEPNNSGPATVQLWGAFSTAIPRDARGAAGETYGDRQSGDVYGPVERGYMFFACPAGRETTCRNEWDDLNRMAAARQAVGFGERGVPNGIVRSRTTPVRNPDPYPLHMGVVSIASYPSRHPEGSGGRQMYASLIAALFHALQ